MATLTANELRKLADIERALGSNAEATEADGEEPPNGYWVVTRGNGPTLSYQTIEAALNFINNNRDDEYGVRFVEFND